jgi:hypothetical protein
MPNPVLNIGKLDDDRYCFLFSTDDGKLTAEISVARSSGPDRRSDDDKRQAALRKLRALVEALDAAIQER